MIKMTYDDLITYIAEKKDMYKSFDVKPDSNAMCILLLRRKDNNIDSILTERRGFGHVLNALSNTTIKME